MANTPTTNFGILKPAAGDINWDDEYAAFADLVDSRLMLGGMKNAIINGDFNIWQRAISFSSGTPIYSADRFLFFRGNSAAGATASRQAASTGVKSKYVMHLQRVSSNALIDPLNLTYSMESIDSLPFAGGNVTLSLQMRKGPDYSGGNVSFLIQQGTGTDERLNIGGFTGQSTVASGSAVLTSSFQKFQVTGTVAAGTTQLGIQIFYTPTGTAGANDWIEIGEVQLEQGTVATLFERRSIAHELMLAQRYYEKTYDLANAPGTNTTDGMRGLVAGSTSRCHGLPFVKRKRSAPTVTLYSQTGTSAKISTIAGVDAGTAVTALNIKESGFQLVDDSGSGLTKGDVYLTHFTADAEL